MGAYGRNATSTELQTQRDALNAAQSQAAVQTQAEAFGRSLFVSQVNDGSLSSTQYVTNLYEAFLQRGPDAGGLGFWSGQASVGAGRQNVLNAFATCSAFRDLSGALYREANWLVSDHLGTPRMIVNKSGTLATMKRHDYLPFGEELFAGTGGRTTTQGYTGDSVRQKFTSKERDNETGLDYFEARYYSSAQGRFTRADSYFGRATSPQTLNLYAYVRNNPLKYVDPTGHEDEGAPKQGKKGLPEGDEGHYDPVSDIQVINIPAEACNCPSPAATETQTQTTANPSPEPTTGFGWGVTGGGHAFAGIGLAGGGGTAGGFMGQFSGRNGLVNGAGLQGGALLYGLAGARAAQPRLIASVPETDDDESAAVVGASAGYGGGLFFTNAGTPEQLRGPFYTRQLNTPWFGVQYDTSANIKVFSFTLGPTLGASYFAGKTGAITTPSLPAVPLGGTPIFRP